MRQIAVVTGDGFLCILSESKCMEKERNGSSRGGSECVRQNEQNAGEKVGEWGAGRAVGVRALQSGER